MVVVGFVFVGGSRGGVHSLYLHCGVFVWKLLRDQAEIRIVTEVLGVGNVMSSGADDVLGAMVSSVLFR